MLTVQVVMALYSSACMQEVRIPLLVPCFLSLLAGY
jgi:hypothetical protein